MKTLNYKEIETTKNPHGVEARKIHDNENVQVVHASSAVPDELLCTDRT